MNYWVFSQNDNSRLAFENASNQKDKKRKHEKKCVKEETILKLFGPISEEEY